MAKYYTTNKLIASIKNRAFIPENQNTFTEESFLTFINEEMDLGIIPLVRSFREDYFLHTIDLTLTSDIKKYTIPHRAMGNSLRELSFVDSSGNVSEMRRQVVEDVPFFGTSNETVYGLRCYYILGDEIVLLFNPTTNTKLRLTYYLRPNNLVSEDAVGKITNIDTSTGEITIDHKPDSFNLNQKYDLVKTRSPFKATAIDLTATDLLGKVLTFNVNDLPSDLKVGDYLCLAEETVIPSVPSEIHALLAQRVAARCLEALGDANGLGMANAKILEMEQKSSSLLSDRVEGSPIKINNRHGFLKQTRRFRGW